MIQATARSDSEELSDQAAQFTADVKRGARRVRSAVRQGAEAVSDAVKPSFGEQLGDAIRSVAKDPSSTPGLVRDLLVDHPFAALATVAVTAAVLGRVILTTRR